MLSSTSRRLVSTTARTVGRRMVAGRSQAPLLSAASLHISSDAAVSENTGRRTFATGYSSIADPHPSLMGGGTAFTTTDDLVSTTDLDDPVIDPNALLRQDMRVMGSLLGKVVQDHEGADIFDKVERMRALAKEWRALGAGRTDPDAAAVFDELANYAQGFSNKELYTTARAFTHFLALANAAEGHHRARRLQASVAAPDAPAAGALYPKSDSCGGVLPKLLADGHSADEIYQALTTQTTELVFTAHPTEVNRRTILAKHRRIQEILNQADAARTSQKNSSFLQSQLDQALYAEIASIWLSDEVNRSKPTPETEAEKGTLVLETVLWETVPLYLRKLDATMQEFLDGRRLPLESAPVVFASWMGGVRWCFALCCFCLIIVDYF